MSMNFNDVAILKIHIVDSHCFIHAINQSEARNLLQNVDLSKKVKHHRVQIFFR